jgi:hypothetical protein
MMIMMAKVAQVQMMSTMMRTRLDQANLSSKRQVFIQKALLRLQQLAYLLIKMQQVASLIMVHLVLLTLLIKPN